MSGYVTSLSGTEWEDWANQLLVQHFGHSEYQKVPDHDDGDAGIEGFTLTSRVAYQAYGCEGEPLKTKERYEKQRVKMTDDIKKFIDNRKKLEKIFGTIKIKRWALFVPYYDSKEIVAHAAKKTQEVIDANLPYIDEDFRVVVCHEEDFSVARDELINAGGRTLRVVAEPASSDDVLRWESTNAGYAKTLEAKLKRMPTLQSDEERLDFKEKVLKWYLEGQSILDSLRKYPEVHEKVLESKSHRENYLVRASLVGTKTSGEVFTSSLDALHETLKEEVRELHAFSSESLAWEAASDWLLRCPLDFPERNGA